LPLGATLAAVTEGFPEVVVAASLAVVTAPFLELHTEAASQEAALPEVASRVEADMVVGGIKRRIVFDRLGKSTYPAAAIFLGKRAARNPLAGRQTGG
jgi:hypothetical protein